MSQTFSFSKETHGVGNGLLLQGTTHLRFGAQWDASTRGKAGWLGRISKKGGLDIDLIGVLMQGQKPVKYVGLSNLNPLKNGTVVHSGDNQTGHGEGDDETITLQLQEIGLEYSSIIFTASVFKGAKSNMFGSMASATQDKGFKGADNVEFSVYDVTTGEASWTRVIMPSLLGRDNCCIIAKVSRTSPSDQSAPWQIEVLEKMVSITPDDMDSIYEKCLGL